MRYFDINSQSIMLYVCRLLRLSQSATAMQLVAVHAHAGNGVYIHIPC